MKKITTILSAATCLASLQPCAAAEGDGLPLMGVAYSRSVVREANISDIIASSKVWVDTFGRLAGICRAGDIHVLNSQEAWRSAVGKKQFSLAIMQSTDYLRLEADAILDPCYTVDAGGKGEELLLLVHKESGIDSLAGLADANLFFAGDKYTSIALLWMDTLLADAGLPATKDFFRKTDEKEKVSGAVLSVFFRRKGACLVTRGAFDLMKEMNPQLGRSLREIARSPRYVSTVVCIRKGCAPEFDQPVREAVARLHENPAGKQLLMAFHIKEFKSFKPECLDTLRALLERHDKLQADRNTNPVAAQGD